MKCELCGAETEFGNPYHCFYGKLISSESGPSQDAMGQRVQVTISKYMMEGAVSAWFCDRCVAARYGMEQRKQGIYLSVGAGLVAFICLVGLLFGPGEYLAALFKIVTLFAALFGVVGVVSLIRGARALNAAHDNPNALRIFLKDDLARNGLVNAFGDTLVINREKARLKGEGFDSFFTRKDKPVPTSPQPQ